MEELRKNFRVPRLAAPPLIERRLLSAYNEFDMKEDFAYEITRTTWQRHSKNCGK